MTEACYGIKRAVARLLVYAVVSVLPVSFGLAETTDVEAQAVSPISKADLIVVGDVAKRHETPLEVSFTITVTRVLKGDLGIQAVDVEHPWGRSGVVIPESADIKFHVSGIWFLHRANTGGWDVYPVAGPDGIFVSLLLPASQTVLAAYARENSGSTEDVVVSEILSGIEQHGLPMSTGIVDAIPANAPALQTALRRFLRSPDVRLRAFAVVRLLGSQSATAIAELKTQWPSLVQDRSAKQEVLYALRDGFRSSNPTAVSELVAWTDTLEDSDELRQAAIFALQRIHTRDTLPFFGNLLDSANEDEQMSAVVAISAFANGCPMQTTANVKSMAYLQFGASPYRNKETEANFAFRRGPR